MPVLAEDQVQVAAIVSRETADKYTEAARKRGTSRAAFLRDLMERGYRDFLREQRVLRSIQESEVA